MADTPQMSALKRLATQLPVANQRLASQQQAARDLQLQQAVSAVPPAQATTRTAQTTGAAAAKQTGDQAVANAQQGVQQQQQVAQLGQQQQGIEAQQRVSDLQAGAREQAMSNEQKLANISEQAKQEMFDSRKKFAEDELGRKFTNDRQMADYVVSQAKSQQDLLDYQQKVDQLSKRSQQASETALNKVSQQLKAENALANQLQDQLSQKGITANEQENLRTLYAQKVDQINKLQQSEIALKLQLQKNQADAANRSSMISSIFSIAGAVGGAVVGGPAGGMAGASLGAGAGSLIAS